MYKIGDKIKIIDVRKINMFPDNFELEDEYEVLDVVSLDGEHTYLTIDIEGCSDYPINEYEYGGIELIERPEAFKSYQKSQQQETHNGI